MVIEVDDHADIRSLRGLRVVMDTHDASETGGRTLTDEDVPMELRTSTSRPTGTKTRRPAPKLWQLLALCIVAGMTSAVEPVPPRRERRRVASHRDQPAPLDATHPPQQRTTVLQSSPEPSIVGSRPDRFAGHGYGDVPGLRWSEDVAPSPEVPRKHERPVLDSLFDEPVIDLPRLDQPVFAQSVFDEPVFDEPVPPEPVFAESLFDEQVFDEPIVTRPDAPTLPSIFDDVVDDAASDLADFAAGRDISSLAEWRVNRAEFSAPEPPSHLDVSSMTSVPPAVESDRPLHPDELPARVRVAHVTDEVELLAAQIERFSVGDDVGGEIDCVIRPTLGWSPDDFGGNRRHDLTWAVAEQLVLRAWAELAERVWIDGSRLEAWMRIDGIGVFVPITLDSSCTIWKFMNEFRSAIELSHC